MLGPVLQLEQKRMLMSMVKEKWYGTIWV